MGEDNRFSVGTGIKQDNAMLIHTARPCCVVRESQNVNLALRVTSVGGQNFEYIKRNARCYYAER
jgi:hypothetical protein